MEKLTKLVLAISPAVQTVMIINNGGADNAALKLLCKKAHIVSFGKNIGIAAALNYACDYAVNNAYRFFIGFDQDSRPGQNMVAQLTTELIEWQARLEGVVAIGPKLVDVRGGGEVVSSFQRFAQLQKTAGDQFASGPVSQLITSGCMIDMLQWGKISRFNEQFFIDFVDHNWCWSLTRQGFKLIGAQQATMQHELSAEIKKFLGFSFYQRKGERLHNSCPDNSFSRTGTAGSWPYCTFYRSAA